MRTSSVGAMLSDRSRAPAPAAKRSSSVGFDPPFGLAIVVARDAPAGSRQQVVGDRYPEGHGHELDRDTPGDDVEVVAERDAAQHQQRHAR